MITTRHWLFKLFAIFFYLPSLSAFSTQLVSTESDPDAFVKNSVNVINGDDVVGANREKDTITNLSSHPDAPLFDHEFMSPTYKKKLREHINTYIQTKGRFL